MAERPSESCQFQSRYGGGYITAAQWLVELVCERLARKNKTTLPHLFWGRVEWRKTFLLQVQKASALLKKYSLPAITAALKTPDGQRAYSLGAAWVEEIIMAEQVKLGRKKEPVVQVDDRPLPSGGAPRPAFVQGSSVLSRLRDLG